MRYREMIPKLIRWSRGNSEVHKMKQAENKSEKMKYRLAEALIEAMPSELTKIFREIKLIKK